MSEETRHENEQSEQVDQPGRRAFLTRAISGLSAAFALFVVYPVARFLKQPAVTGGNVKRTVAAKVADVTVDSGRIFRFGNSPGLLINTPDGKIKAFSAVCTHLDCTVQYVPGENHILCACHNGKYDLNGNVISGPPPRPLESYDVTLQDEDVIVTRA
ncbi:MAG: ubiquinol-cytochrome c reductase iron-sulfur subunit [Candidatus Zixiibacteriota bacterium]